MGKTSKGKIDRFISSLRAFSHETVSNHSVAILLSGPCPPSAALQALAGGSVGSSDPEQGRRGAGEIFKVEIHSAA